jgi:hypothetical protein
MLGVGEAFPPELITLLGLGLPVLSRQTAVGAGCSTSDSSHRCINWRLNLASHSLLGCLSP